MAVSKWFKGVYTDLARYFTGSSAVRTSLLTHPTTGYVVTYYITYYIQPDQSLVSVCGVWCLAMYVLYTDGRLASGAQENCIYIYSKPQTGKDHKGERVVCEQTLSAHNNPVWTLATLNGMCCPMHYALCSMHVT